MITEAKYCKGCGQRIETSEGMFKKLFGKKTYHEIDGMFYCEVCAREVVKKRRAMLR